MSQYGQVTKHHTFHGVAKLVFWLHTAGTENPDNPQTHPSTSDLNECHSRCPQTPPRHPPDTPKASPVNITCQQTTTDANRHCQTPKITDRCCLSMSGGVCWRLLLSVGMLCSLELSGGCLGDDLGCSEWYSWKLEAFGCVLGVSGFSVPAVCSQNTNLA